MLCMKRTVNFTMSVRPALRDRIIAAAAADGRSASSWVGRLVERALGQIDARAVSSALGGPHDVLATGVADVAKAAAPAPSYADYDGVYGKPVLREK
jgi:hypothetical protein